MNCTDNTFHDTTSVKRSLDVVDVVDLTEDDVNVNSSNDFDEQPLAKRCKAEVKEVNAEEEEEEEEEEESGDEYDVDYYDEDQIIQKVLVNDYKKYEPDCLVIMSNEYGSSVHGLINPLMFNLEFLDVFNGIVDEGGADLSLPESKEDKMRQFIVRLIDQDGFRVNVGTTVVKPLKKIYVLEYCN